MIKSESSRFLTLSMRAVVPAKAGIHKPAPWIPAFAGMTEI
jgi:hypothetical protein